MKRLLFIIAMVGLMDVSSYAAAPSTTCPTGYTTIKTSGTLADGTCPTGYVSAGNPTSCLAASPGGECYMYVPANMEFTDDYGTYKYTTICPLTD